jgi:ubiquinone/menaquinone biosynthesis C-methylase UbiE
MQSDSRHRWAAEKLAVNPDNSILEIGCGHGITASLVARQLHSGKLTAIDRSAAMITRARIRNQEFIAQGKAAYYTATLQSSTFAPASFDKVYAFNVHLFLQPSDGEFQRIAALLKPPGLLYVFYQPPVENTVVLAQNLRTAMENHSFRVIETDTRPALPASVVCVVAAPEKNIPDY